jgi:aryl-alcohol dehydrogenase-like predicted oxidoreductase
MKHRPFGRTGWQVSDVGYGMWGMGAWSGSEDNESLDSLQRAIDLGCNFFDTAWVYGDSRSEKLLGRILRANSAKKLYVASKVPPKTGPGPPRTIPRSTIAIRPATSPNTSRKASRIFGLETLDLIQLHTWNDNWVEDSRHARKTQNRRQS